MASNVIDLQAARAAREAVRQEKEERREVIREQMRPYASMDDLPDISFEGQLAVRRIVYGNLR
jgi:hypothetical protein